MSYTFQLLTAYEEEVLKILVDEYKQSGCAEIYLDSLNTIFKEFRYRDHLLLHDALRVMEYKDYLAIHGAGEGNDFFGFRMVFVKPKGGYYFNEKALYEEQKRKIDEARKEDFHLEMMKEKRASRRFWIQLIFTALSCLVAIVTVALKFVPNDKPQSSPTPSRTQSVDTYNPDSPE